MAGEDIQEFLRMSYDFNALSPVLTSLGITLDHILLGENFDRAPRDKITNEVAIELSHLMTRLRKPKTFMVQWLRKLYLPCTYLSDSQVKTKCSNVLKKQIQLTKNQSGNNLSDFLKSQFIVIEENSTPLKSIHCKACLDKDNAIKENESLIKKLRLENECLRNLNEQIEIKTKIIDELQIEKARMISDLEEMKQKVVVLTDVKKKVKNLERTVEEMKNSKLFYKRNMEMKKTIEDLERQVKNLTSVNLKLKIKKDEQSKKVKLEQDMKNKYKKEKTAMAEENQNMLYALNDATEEETIYLKEKENKTTMYSNNIRQLYMALQGEANVAGTQASKAVMLVSKYLFKKNITLQDLPCPKTCLNFMNEANHIAKQQIVTKIMESKHFTYATDGTSRQKKHFMEHHIVLDSGSTLSIGYSEIADDKASTLLDKSIDLFDELADVYCQANDEESGKSDIFKEIVSKIQSLMSDRAANMKAFNRKMQEYKKSVVGEDAVIHFLYCNAHFLIGLAEETDKAIKEKENGLTELLKRKLGRDNQAIFSNFKSNETCASRLIRTCADILGPRGDEKNGCREEWLAHCDSVGTKSKITSHRSNRFNNTFENPVALLYHHKDVIHFLTHRVTNSNRKLLSVIFDLEDKHIMSIVAAVALLAVHMTTPYWKLMNSKTPYGQFAKHVQKMKAALERWSSDDFEIDQLNDEIPIFGDAFQVSFDIPRNFLQSDACYVDVTTSAFKLIAQRCLVVLNRQLFDFLPGGVYGDNLPDDLQDFLDKCPLTNLTGERMFGDLDYDMTRRRTAETFMRSSLSMCKHNNLSSFLDKMTPSKKKKAMGSARKFGKSLKRKHSEAVKTIREQKKMKIDDNERKRKEKEIADKEKELELLNEIVAQGGLCTTKDDLRKLMNQPKALQNLKIQMRFRKYHMGAKDLRLTGNRQILLNSLCNHLGVDYDSESEGEEESDSDESDENSDNTGTEESEISVDSNYSE